MGAYLLMKMLLTLASLILLLGSTIHGCPPPLEERLGFEASRDINYRLPRHLTPLLYDITLEPDLEPATFTGAVTIVLTPDVEGSKNITVHTRQLNLTEESIEVIDNNGTKNPITNIERDDVREFYIFHTEQPLIKGSIYNLSIPHYEGILNLENGGFYLAKYWDKQGRERRFATTQFQSSSARRAYPCLDEPHMKASFVVNLVRPQNLSSISNEELSHSNYWGNGKVVDVYKPTIKMSTYLTAFVVSDYKHTNTTKKQRVFADADSIDDGQADFALDVGIDILKSLEDYLGVKYSLSKMDQIAIPDNFFGPGAMENWGLVTYRKTYIVYDYASATSSEHQRTVTIVAHEFAHQWFGNLVTCDWWKYIWLNEGFANYFESFASALIRPDWDFEQQFLLNSVHSSLNSDSTNLTKPMNSDGTPSYVAYQKAGSVIRMFEHFLTNSVFRKALTIYLKANAFRSVKPNDLYEALQTALDGENKGYLLGNLTVSRIMNTWDSQAGYPIVNVTRNYNTGSIELVQERFFKKDYNINDNSTWYIPINFLSINNNRPYDTSADFWMTKKREVLNSTLTNSSWLILNKQQTGFYRINYDVTNWKLIANYLLTGNANDIPVLNRAQLIDDAFTLAEAERLDYDIALTLTKYMSKETQWAPISVFTKTLSVLDRMLAVTPEYNLLQNYINRSLSGAYHNLGFLEGPFDRHLDKYTRENVLNWLCKIGNGECRSKSLKWIREIRQNDNSSSVTPNLQTPVYCGAMAVGNIDDWEFLYGKYEKAENKSENSRLLRGLTCSENKEILNGFLSKVLDDNSTLRKNDRYSVFSNVLNAGNTGLNTVFEYIDENLDKLKHRINIPAILREVGSRFSTDKQLDKLKELGRKYSLSSNDMDDITQGTRDNIEWSEKHIDVIKRWLIEFSAETMWETS